MTKRGDTIRIAAETCDVLVNPIECAELIVQCIVWWEDMRHLRRM